jgi:hypothetical protein
MKKLIDMPLRHWKTLHGLAGAAFVAVMLLVAPVAGLTQETTSAIRGSISQPDGTPAAGANVRVRDTRTGSTQTATTSSSGQFTMTGLRVGGPYTIMIEAEGLAPQSITDVELDLGDTYTLNVALSAEQIEEITVTAGACRSGNRGSHRRNRRTG